MTPRASALQGEGALEGLASTLLVVSRIATIVILPIAVTFLFRGATFIALWMGPEYADLGGDVLWILSVGLVFLAGRQVVAATFIGLNLHRVLAVVLLVEGLANIVISVLLVRPLGLVGVAIGNLAPSLAVSLGFVPWYTARHLRIPVGQLMREAWVRPALAMVPFGALTVVVENAWPAASLIAFFVQVAVALPAAGAGVWVIALSVDERRRLMDYARAAGRRLVPRGGIRGR